MGKSGASFTRKIEKPCLYCGKKVLLRTKRSRPVCTEWLCQRKEEIYKMGLETERQNRRREQRKREAA